LDVSGPVLPGWSLTCPACGSIFAPGNYPRGCPACRERGVTQALVVAYDNPGALPPLERTGEGIWKYAAFLPALAEEHRRTLGEGDTPLLHMPLLSEITGCEHLYLKMETQNPTAAHKDRFHAVAVAVGKALGYDRVVSASTGNHGLSMTAYANAHGMKAVVIANQRMPTLLQRAIRLMGGLPLLAPPHLSDALEQELIEGEGWYPSTGSWPMPLGNHFGIEGYKTIGIEIYQQLGSRMPDLVFLPVAGGDGVVGMWRAIQALRRLGLPQTEARLVACQPAGAAPLVSALEQGLDHVPFLADAYSIALSIGDPITGALALPAIRETGGFGIRVTDEAILETGRLLMRAGLLVEPSSAASVAGALQILRERPELREQTLVCVVTSSGLKWLDDYADDGPLPAGVRVETVDEARRAVEAYVEGSSPAPPPR